MNKEEFYSKKAKHEGYPARSIYKLQQINTKHKLLKPGQKILELGAAPGSWAILSAKVIGKEGAIYALDTKKLSKSALGLSNLKFYQADLYNFDFKSELNIKFDLVLSDAAPNTTGIKSVDQLAAFNLNSEIIKIASENLKVNGALLMKSFQGAKTNELISHLKQIYNQVNIEKPASSKKGSFEIFILGKHKK